MRWIQLGLVTASLLGFASTSNAQVQNVQTRNGAILGGVTGGVIGGIVGHQSDKTAEGALIGGAVGAIAGGVLGNNRDHADRQRYQQYQTYQYQQRHSHSHPVVVTSPTYVEKRTYVPVQTKVVNSRRPVTVSEVISMSQSGVSDAVIVSHLQTNGIVSTPDVNEIIWMSEKGVSDYVITFMQQNTKTVTTPVSAMKNEVVIREEVRPTTTIIETVPVRHTAPVPVYVERRGF